MASDEPDEDPFQRGRQKKACKQACTKAKDQVMSNVIPEKMKKDGANEVKLAKQVENSHAAFNEFCDRKYAKEAQGDLAAIAKQLNEEEKQRKKSGGFSFEMPSFDFGDGLFGFSAADGLVGMIEALSG